MVCDKDGVSKEGVSKMVCDKDGVSKRVCESWCVCERWCVTKRCVKDGVCDKVVC